MSKIKAKKPRKCSVCGSIEHRADYHGSKRERNATDADMMPADIAMRTMIDPFYAVWLVTEGSVGEALANATRATVESRRIGLGGLAGDTMLRARAELELRARDLPSELLKQARELRHQMDLAVTKYRTVEFQITDKLGYPRSK